MKLKNRGKPNNKKNPIMSVLYLVLLVITIPVYLAAGPMYDYASASFFGRAAWNDHTDIEKADTNLNNDSSGETDRETEADEMADESGPPDGTEAENAIVYEASVEEETEKEPVITWAPRYADDHYFDDAMFIGDSRTIGLYDYSGIEADYFCSKGYCAYQWIKGKKTIHQNTGEKKDLGEALLDREYGKVYLMVGLNDGGFGSAEDFRPRAAAMLNCILQTQPDAVVFLMANLHTTAKWSAAHPNMGNEKMTQINDVLSELSETDERCFYLDVNPLFCDEEGNLKSEFTSDGVHLYASKYEGWTEFLKAAAVYREEE